MYLSSIYLFRTLIVFLCSIFPPNKLRLLLDGTWNKYITFVFYTIKELLSNHDIKTIWFFYHNKENSLFFLLFFYFCVVFIQSPLAISVFCDHLSCILNIRPKMLNDNCCYSLLILVSIATIFKWFDYVVFREMNILY